MVAELFTSPPSPFAQKVRVVAAEVGTDLVLTEMSASPVARNAGVAGVNPLGKIPALRLDDGSVLYDSRVICRYLGEGTALYPTGPALWRALRREALADGLMDAALLARYEVALRPEALRWAEWTAGQLAKIEAALAVMESEAPEGGEPDIGDIATGAALAYLDLRFADLGWREGRPRLAAFAARLFARPSFASDGGARAAG